MNVSDSELLKCLDEKYPFPKYVSLFIVHYLFIVTFSHLIVIEDKREKQNLHCFLTDKYIRQGLVKLSDRIGHIEERAIASYGNVSSPIYFIRGKTRLVCTKRRSTINIYNLSRQDGMYKQHFSLVSFRWS